MRFLLPLLLVVCVLVPLVRSLPALYLNESGLEEHELESGPGVEEVESGLEGEAGFSDSEEYDDESPEEDWSFQSNYEPEVAMFEPVTMDTNLLATEEVF